MIFIEASHKTLNRLKGKIPVVLKAFLIFGSVYAKAPEGVAVPLLCYCVGHVEGQAEGGA